MRRARWRSAACPRGFLTDAVRALPGRQAAMPPGDLRDHRAPSRDAYRDHGAVWLDVIAGAGPLERLRALVDVFAREVAAYPNAARLVLVEAPGVGPAALAHTSRTSRLVERAISQGLSEGADAPAPSRLTVKRIVTDGTRLVAHACATVAPRSSATSSQTRASPPPRRVPRDRNRFLRSSDPGVSVLDDGTFTSYARSARREPTRQADLAAGPVPEWRLR